MARRTSALFASVDFTFVAMICAPLSRRGRRRDDAELLQHTDLVPAVPVLDPLPGLVEAGDDHHAHLDHLPGGRDAEQGSGVRAPHGEPAAPPLALPYYLFLWSPQIRS